MASLLERYNACMVLSAVGDAIGYRNGLWEFCDNGETIHKELLKFGGLSKLHVTLPSWRVSDDTVLHLATAKGIVDGYSKSEDKMYMHVAHNYIEGCKDMSGRAPGPTTMMSVFTLQTQNTWRIPFNAKGGGCGASMRSMAIGLLYDVDQLIPVAIETGRMTHHHPTGYLGGLVSALFTRYGIAGYPVTDWATKMLTEVLPRALEYVQNSEWYTSENLKSWSYFTDKWESYMRDNIPGHHGDVKSRDEFYKSFSYDGWGGASGHDSTIIAYDALCGAGDSWEELISRGALHSGDSDSTAAIACAWWGAVHGFVGVPRCNYKDVEYRNRCEDIAEKMLNLNCNNS